MSAATGSGFEVSTPTAPTIAASATAGSLGNGNYSYKVTYVNAFGESLPSAASSTVNPNPLNSMTVTIPVSSDTTVTSRKIYRTAVGGTVYRLAATVANNTATSTTDSLADGSLGAMVPVINTCAAAQNVYGLVKFSVPIQSSGGLVTAGTTQTQLGAAPLPNMFNSVTTGNADDGVRLPTLNANMIGMMVFIQNLSANQLRVYPGDGQTTQAGASVGAANAHVVHAASVARWYVATSATNWLQI